MPETEDRMLIYRLDQTSSEPGPSFVPGKCSVWQRTRPSPHIPPGKMRNQSPLRGSSNVEADPAPTRKVPPGGMGQLSTRGRRCALGAVSSNAEAFLAPGQRVPCLWLGLTYPCKPQGSGSPVPTSQDPGWDPLLILWPKVDFGGGCPSALFSPLCGSNALSLFCRTVTPGF